MAVNDLPALASRFTPAYRSIDSADGGFDPMRTRPNGIYFGRTGE